MNLTVGQKLWYVPHARWDGQPRELTVSAVGRKWATVDNGRRVCLTTGAIDGKGYMSPRSCWIDRATYEAAENLRREWSSIRQYLTNTAARPPEATLEAMQKIRSLLNIPPEKS